MKYVSSRVRALHFHFASEPSRASRAILPMRLNERRENMAENAGCNRRWYPPLIPCTSSCATGISSSPRNATLRCAYNAHDASIVCIRREKIKGEEGKKRKQRVKNEKEGEKGNMKVFIMLCIVTLIALTRNAKEWLICLCENARKERVKSRMGMSRTRNVRASQIYQYKII